MCFNHRKKRIFKYISYFSQYSSINIKIYRNFNQKSYFFCLFSQKCFFQIMPLFQNLRRESPKFTELGLQMRNINTKISSLAIFQKLIFGSFTAIFVKNGGEKETKLDILAKILNYRKMAKLKIFLIHLP